MRFGGHRNNRATDSGKSKTRKKSDEIYFYISTSVLSAPEFCLSIRNHQGIENRNHNVRDVTMKVDKS